MYANVRAVFVPGDTFRTGDADRARLRVGGKRVRVQAKGLQGYGSRTGSHYPGNASSVTRFRMKRRTAANTNRVDDASSSTTG